MYLILLSLGVIVSAVGLAAIAFGVPIHEFGLGNTLIMAGATGLAGGLVLIGLAAVLRELRRLGATLAGRHAEMSAPAVAEPAAIPVAAAPPVERPRPGPLAPPRSAEPEEPAPPRAPYGRRPAERGAPPRSEPEPPAEPKPELRAEPKPELRAEPKPELRAGTPAPRARAEPKLDVAPEPPPERRRMFDTVWPRAGKTNDVSPAPRDEPAFERGVASEPAAAPAVPAASPPASPAPPEPVSILKSGVIDGMGYTLYTDGSIEAQLAQGTVRFASIEELRIHLERQE